jgi:hypothetical protein
MDGIHGDAIQAIRSGPIGRDFDRVCPYSRLGRHRNYHRRVGSWQLAKLHFRHSSKHGGRRFQLGRRGHEMSRSEIIDPYAKIPSAFYWFFAG